MSDNAQESSKNVEKVRSESNWTGVLFQLYIHASLVYGCVFIFQAKLLTIAFSIFLILCGVLGTTAGSHRLWAHRSYTASPFLRVCLMLFQTLGGSGTIYNWVLDHRIHHKFHGTKNDPFDYTRGLFYAQIGNRMIAKDPAEREELVKQIDMSDIEADKVVMFQKRFYWILMPVLCILFPLNTPPRHWGETLLLSFMVNVCFRLPVVLHLTWLVNSARTIWELKPDDRFFSDSNLVFLIKKSHWHKYHYTIPWDCLTDEFGSYNSSCTTTLIKMFAACGLATGLKTVDSKEMTLGLMEAMKTGRPIGECVTDIREEMQHFQYEDNVLSLIQNH